jgi:single-stranded-DNA-specific exonuclease
MVDESTSVPRWLKAPTPESSVELVRAGYSEWLASVLARRGVRSADDAAAFLNPGYSDLLDPELLGGLPRAVDRLVQARNTGQSIAVIGDYDVDGISATAILLAVFRRCGIETEAILPSRFEGGYGFQPIHVEQAVEIGCGLIVTADCGSTALAAIDTARKRGIDVIVTDHHLSSEPLPDRVIEINPKRQDSGYPFRDLCGAGVALKLATSLMYRLEVPIKLESLLRIACLGTICDLVPLLGENRAISSLGLAALPETRSRGLRALIDRAGLRPPFSAPDIGFRIGPRINAAGRLSDPRPALELLMTGDQAVANEVSAQLEELNRSRQIEESQVVEAAEKFFTELSELPPLLVAWDQSWHRGVVGIAAGRIARKFNRPTILLSVDERLATGSGRSIAGIHLHQFLSRWESRYERFGGHAQAIGLTLVESDLEELRQIWQTSAMEKWPAETLAEQREYELALAPHQLDMDFLKELEQLEPFGMANRPPIIRVGPLELQQSVRRFGRGHLSAVAKGQDGSSISLLGWGWQDRIEDLSNVFEALGCLELDRYRRQPTLRLIDARPWSGSSESA